jgi:hypothetical protein
MKRKISTILILFIMIWSTNCNAEWIIKASCLTTGAWINNSSWYAISGNKHIGLIGTNLTFETKIFNDYIVLSQSLEEGKYYYFVGGRNTISGNGSYSAYYLGDNSNNKIRDLGIGEGIYFKAQSNDENATRLYTYGYSFPFEIYDDGVGYRKYNIANVLAQIYEAELIDDYWKISSLFLGMITGLTFVIGVRSMGV